MGGVVTKSCIQHSHKNDKCYKFSFTVILNLRSQYIITQNDEIHIIKEVRIYYSNVDVPYHSNTWKGNFFLSA